MRIWLSAVGIGLSATVLLMAASIGPAMTSRQTRADSIVPQYQTPPWAPTDGVSAASLSTAGSFEYHDTETPYREKPVRGADLAAAPENLGSVAPPPGVDRFPRPGQLVLSPALRALLASPEGAQLRPRLAGEVVGSIGDAGLLDPQELRFYRGAEPSGLASDGSNVATGWGTTVPLPEQASATYLPVLTAAGTVIVILPLLIFVGLMSRVGGPSRDRRLSAMRLLGASCGQLRRITMAEALVASVGGLLIGVAGYLAARNAAPWLSLGQAAFFTSDVTPEPVALLAIALIVPALAIGASWAGVRRISAEPLGVSREPSPVVRRPWAGLVLLGVGVLAMVGSLYSGALNGRLEGIVLMVLAIVGLLTSVGALLPWALQRLVCRLPTAGIGWQLAVRRLQLDSSTPSQVVAGICVVLAGAIALQPLLAVLAADQTGSDTGAGTPAYRVFVNSPTAAELSTVIDLVADAPGVTKVSGGVPIGGSIRSASASTFGAEADPTAGFVALATTCRTIPAADCRDGSVYLTSSDDEGAAYPAPTVPPGTTISLQSNAGPAVAWTMPKPTGTIDLGQDSSFFSTAPLITPGALGTDADAVLKGISLDLRVYATNPTAEVADQLRTAMSDLTWRASVATTAESTGNRGQLASTVRTGLLLAACLTLLVAAVGLLVMSTEQLAARRRALTLTVATGVPRSVIIRSLLIGAAVPIAVGVTLAVVVGICLSAFLLTLVGEQWHLEWNSIAGFAGAAILLVMIATLPVAAIVRRMTNPEGLRTG